MAQKRAWLYCRVAHNESDGAEVLAVQQLRLGSYAREHNSEAENGKVDMLFLHSLTRLGRDSDKVAKYWRLLCNLGASAHTAWGDRFEPRHNAPWNDWRNEKTPRIGA